MLLIVIVLLQFITLPHDQKSDVLRKAVLKKSDETFTVLLPDNPNKEYRIRRELLFPEEDLQEEEGAYVSSFDFNDTVTVFSLGDGRLGLHLSSLGVQAQGSAQMAAGRDLFLILDPKTSLLSNGRIRLGITKSRGRFMGCFSARTSHFLIGDINNDSMTDIGVIAEEMECRDRGDDTVVGPFYNQDPVRWYMLKKNGWELEHIGEYPETFTELPLIGTTMNPIDFAAKIVWQSYDPEKWNLDGNQERLFVPEYRRRLIAGEQR